MIFVHREEFGCKMKGVDDKLEDLERDISELNHSLGDTDNSMQDDEVHDAVITESENSQGKAMKILKRDNS
jgi:hypothetical protein